MDRTMIFPGQIPLETDLLGTNKNVMIALAKLSAVILGTATRLNGLPCVPNSPAALNVVVGAGEIYSLQNVDGTAYSSIAVDARSILKQGMLFDSLTLACPAPSTPGQSINYLVQVTHQETDADAVVLPYYNASNPSQAYSGPNNAGTTNNTVRKGVCAVNVKAGIAATTGTQVTPAPDVGFTGAYVVTVANGQTTITAPNIAVAPGAPFITERLVDKISQATADARYAINANYSISSLPVTNIGPITVIEVAETWIWSTSAYYTGYRSPLCGRPVDGHTVTPLASEVDAIGGLLPKASYARLWAYARENSLVVSQATWTANLGAHWFVDVDATYFRAPDLRDMFRRFTGTDLDTANARTLGSYKSDTLQGHWHATLSEVGLNSGAGGTNAGVPATNSSFGSPTGTVIIRGLVTDTAHGTPRIGMETAPKHVAFYPRIHA